MRRGVGEDAATGKTRLSGVSSFGFSGAKGDTALGARATQHVYTPEPDTDMAFALNSYKGDARAGDDDDANERALLLEQLGAFVDQLDADFSRAVADADRGLGYGGGGGGGGRVKAVLESTTLLLGDMGGTFEDFARGAEARMGERNAGSMVQLTQAARRAKRHKNSHSTLMSSSAATTGGGSSSSSSRRAEQAQAEILERRLAAADASVLAKMWASSSSSSDGGGGGCGGQLAGDGGGSSGTSSSSSDGGGDGGEALQPPGRAQAASMQIFVKTLTGKAITSKGKGRAQKRAAPAALKPLTASKHARATPAAAQAAQAAPQEAVVEHQMPEHWTGPPSVPPRATVSIVIVEPAGSSAVPTDAALAKAAEEAKLYECQKCRMFKTKDQYSKKQQRATAKKDRPGSGMTCLDCVTDMCPHLKKNEAAMALNAAKHAATSKRYTTPAERANADNFMSTVSRMQPAAASSFLKTNPDWSRDYRRMIDNMIDNVTHSEQCELQHVPLLARLAKLGVKLPVVDSDKKVRVLDNGCGWLTQQSFDAVASSWLMEQDGVTAIEVVLQDLVKWDTNVSVLCSLPPNKFSLVYGVNSLCSIAHCDGRATEVAAALIDGGVVAFAQSNRFKSEAAYRFANRLVQDGLQLLSFDEMGANTFVLAIKLSHAELAPLSLNAQVLPSRVLRPVASTAATNTAYTYNIKFPDSIGDGYDGQTIDRERRAKEEFKLLMSANDGFHSPRVQDEFDSWKRRRKTKPTLAEFTTCITYYEHVREEGEQPFEFAHRLTMAEQDMISSRDDGWNLSKTAAMVDYELLSAAGKKGIKARAKMGDFHYELLSAAGKKGGKARAKMGDFSSMGRKGGKKGGGAAGKARAANFAGANLWVSICEEEYAKGVRTAGKLSDGARKRIERCLRESTSEVDVTAEFKSRQGSSHGKVYSWFRRQNQFICQGGKCGATFKEWEGLRFHLCSAACGYGSVVLAGIPPVKRHRDRMGSKVMAKHEQKEYRDLHKRLQLEKKKSELKKH